MSCDWRWLAICVVNSEFAVARRDMYFDRYHLRETRFSGIEVIRKAGVIDQKRQNRKKKKKRAIKDHKNDWLTDATRLKLVMKNKWTRSSF